MKKTIFFLLGIFLLFESNVGNAQGSFLLRKIEFGVKLASSMDKSLGKAFIKSTKHEIPSFSTYYVGGIQYGLAIRYNINSRWSINSEYTHNIRRIVVNIKNQGPNEGWFYQDQTSFEIPLKLNFKLPLNEDNSFTFHCFAGPSLAIMPNISWTGGGYGGTTPEEFEKSNLFHNTSVESNGNIKGGVFGAGIERQFKNRSFLYFGFSYYYYENALLQTTEYDIGSNSFNTSRNFAPSRFTLDLNYLISWRSLKRLRQGRKSKNQDYWKI